MRTQLLEKRSWHEFDDIACSGEMGAEVWEAAAEGISANRLENLVSIDIVPGLVLAHRPSALTTETLDADTTEIVDEFTSLALAQEAPALISYVENLQSRGFKIETLYLGLLSATARRLGEYWDSDTVDFASVTIGLWRLQEVLRNLSGAFQAEAPKPAHGHRALLLSTEGEQHNFGLAMLGEFLFRDGWSIAGGPGLKTDDVRELLGREFFSLVGLSASAESRLPAMKSMIRLIRRVSRNRKIIIMVGGRLFIERPELVASVGADATAPDARLAVLQAERLINNLEGPR